MRYLIIREEKSEDNIGGPDKVRIRYFLEAEVTGITIIYLVVTEETAKVI